MSGTIQILLENNLIKSVPSWILLFLRFWVSIPSDSSVELLPVITIKIQMEARDKIKTEKKKKTQLLSPNGKNSIKQ